MKIKLDCPPQPIAEFIFAHGAGAGSDSEFMQVMAESLLALDICVVRFDFPYMRKVIETGKRRPPDKLEVLEHCFIEVINQRKSQLPLFIGGKSMGGRIATMIAEKTPVHGTICYGYPFHPPGKPDKLRTAHLIQASKDILILQGEKDTFGNQQEVVGFRLSDAIQIEFLSAADHSFKPLKSSGFTQQQHILTAAATTADFIRSTSQKGKQ